MIDERARLLRLVHGQVQVRPHRANLIAHARQIHFAQVDRFERLEGDLRIVLHLELRASNERLRVVFFEARLELLESLFAALGGVGSAEN